MKKLIPLTLLLASTLALVGCSPATTTDSGEPATPEVTDTESATPSPSMEEESGNSIIDPDATALDSDKPNLGVAPSGTYSLNIALGERRTFELPDGTDILGWSSEVSPVGIIAYLPSETEQEGNSNIALMIGIAPGSAVITLTSPTDSSEKITIGVTVGADATATNILRDARDLSVDLVGLTREEAFATIEANDNPRITGFVISEDGVVATDSPEYESGLIKLTIVDGMVTDAGVG